MANDSQQQLFGAPAPPPASPLQGVPAAETTDTPDVGPEDAGPRVARRAGSTSSRSRAAAPVARAMKKPAVQGAARTDRAGRPRVYLVDGANIAYRAHYSIRGLVNRRGEATGALFGFCSMIFALLHDEEPTHLAIVWDPPGDVFRNALFPDYKGTRPDMPDELRAQMPMFPEIVRALGIPLLCVPGFEADDVIGTLVERWRDTCDLTIVTSDKDLMQLVRDPNVQVLDTMKNLRVGEAEVAERWGVPPSRIVEMLSLMGDSSDNIPGVWGIGEKGAAQLLAQHPSIEALFAAKDRLSGRVSKPMQAEGAWESAVLSRTLATIRLDVPIEAVLEDLQVCFPPEDGAAATAIFQELEFHRFLALVGGAMKNVESSGDVTVTTSVQLLALADQIRAAEVVAFDVLSTPHVATEAALVGLAFSTGPQGASYVPILAPPDVAVLCREEVLSVLGPALRDARALVGHDCKRGLVVLAEAGLSLPGVAGDTMIADYLLQPQRRSHAIDGIALTTLQHKMMPVAEALAEHGGELRSAPLEVATRYAAENAHIIGLCHAKLLEALDAAGLRALYDDVEVPLISVLAGMERTGIAVDVPLLRDLSVELGIRVVEAEARCHELAGQEFNPNSPKQLARILFEELGLPVVKRTKSGPSTDATVLEQLAADHALPAAVLTYRSLDKLKSTYVDALPGFVNPRTNRIHTTFNQALAETGRLSSEDPNLQNIPIRTPEGRRIRASFVAAPGMVFLSADYSQVELRVLAHLCGGEGGFARAFASGLDVHRSTAAEVFDVPLSDVTSEMRSAAKAINFGLVYGQGAWGLAQVLKISRKDATAYIKKYKRQYPEIDDYMRLRVEEAMEHQFVTTILGRRRRITDLTSSNFNQREAAKRLAINTPVQGSAADLIKVAMVRVAAMLPVEFPSARLLLQVHDELLFEVTPEQAESLARRVVGIMEGAADLRVPLRVDSGVGATWEAAH